MAQGTVRGRRKAKFEIAYERPLSNLLPALLSAEDGFRYRTTLKSTKRPGHTGCSDPLALMRLTATLMSGCLAPSYKHVRAKTHPGHCVQPPDFPMFGDAT